MIFKVSRTFWAVFFSCLTMLALGLADNIRGPLFPELIRFFDISNAVGSLSFAFASGAAFLGTVASTFTLKKIQIDRFLIFAILLMGIGLATNAVAPGYVIYILGAVIFGFGMGSMAVAQNLLIAENVPLEHQPRALSGLHSLYGLSSLAAPFLASRAPQWFSHHAPDLFIMTQWRSAFYITAFICLLMFVFATITRAEPKFHHLVDEEAHSKKIKDKRPMYYMALFFAGYVAAEILVATRLAQYMRSYFGMDLEQSSNYVTYFFIFLLAGRWFFTMKHLKYPLKKQLTASLLLSIVSILLGLFVNPFFLALTGLMMAPFYPMSVAYISELAGPRTRTYLTTAMSVQCAFVIMMHVGVGYLTDVFGLFYAFGISLFLLLMSLVCVNTHPPLRD